MEAIGPVVWVVDLFPMVRQTGLQAGCLTKILFLKKIIIV